MRVRGLLPLAAFALLGSVAPASAELIFLSSGRTLSVKAHRVDGESIVLLLRGGGEIVCDRTLVDRIEPDEVPYPEPPASEVASTSFAAVPYAELIDAASARHGVDPRLVRALIQVESGYQERARSRKGAMGLMQLMPETAREYALADPYDPRANIEAGIRHLRSLLDRFDLSLALAAYNAGEAAVQKFGGMPPYAETRDYVARILKLLGVPR